jgi:hypothetical protein
MKRHIVDPGWEARIDDFERLDGTIQVFIVDGVLIMIDSISRACYLVANEENTIVTRIRFELIDRRICPRLDCWLHAYGRASR